MSRALPMLFVLTACAPPPIVGLNEVGPDWAEIHNADAAPADIGAWTLQMDLRTPWTLPDTVEVQPADVRVIDGLDLTEGVLIVRDAEGTVVQEVDLPALEPGESYGRSPDGDGRWRVFDTPTPGDLNGS